MHLKAQWMLNIHLLSIRPFRNAVFTSIWWIFQPISAAMEITALIEVYLATGAKVSS
jgi:hypothetical protein